ncbi:MAG TPA: hypothetical protein VK886_04915 [Vicinamibacterales bacterium]|nr:hypothetical protein [Vicinamibacterales bacterium]
MNEQTATRVANVVMIAAAGAAAWVVLRDPRRRRGAARLLKALAAGPLPAWFVRELRTAWEESGQRSIMAR